MLPQPTETTCGPTCLHAVYRYWGDEAKLQDVIGRTRALQHGGTFAVFLACDALPPYGPHPYGGMRDYWIRMDRVFNAILLGIVTHDANLLVLAPRKSGESEGEDEIEGGSG